MIIAIRIRNLAVAERNGPVSGSDASAMKSEDDLQLNLLLDQAFLYLYVGGSCGKSGFVVLDTFICASLERKCVWIEG